MFYVLIFIRRGLALILVCLHLIQASRRPSTPKSIQKINQLEYDLKPPRDLTKIERPEIGPASDGVTWLKEWLLAWQSADELLPNLVRCLLRAGFLVCIGLSRLSEHHRG